MPDLDNKRPQRVAELIAHELARLISTELKDPRIGFVTVTEVRMSSDLHSARVYVSVYGDAEHRQASLEGLGKAAGYLRHQLGPALKLRYTPELVFCHDDSLDRADRVQALLIAVAKGETATPEPRTEPPVDVQTDRSALAERRREFEATPPPSTERKGRHGRGGRGREGQRRRDR